jgi:hypothetical protein
MFNLNIPPDEDWLLLGDFNFIRSPSNRNKPGGDISDMMLFNDFIREQNLTEIPIKGRKYTWSNMQENPLLEQLDWFFTSLHWNVSYPSTSVTPQGKPTSDHTPLVIAIHTFIPASRIFRFENFWVAHQGFLQTVAASWNKPANLNAKLKRLRYDLKFWSKSISKLSVCIDNTNRALLEINNIEDCRPLSCPEANFRKILRAHLLRLSEYQNAYWKKRCTIRWTKFGDENTNFFTPLQLRGTEGIPFLLLLNLMVL